LLRRRMWLVPLRDATGFLTWIAGYFFTRINWRGSGFHVVHGKLVPVEQPAKAAAR
jgi:hypothetical protein